MKRDSESSYVHMKRDTIREKYRRGDGVEWQVEVDILSHDYRIRVWVITSWNLWIFVKYLLYGGRVGEQKLVEEGEFKILLLFYLEIELAFQIMVSNTMVSFEFLCLILYSNSYVSFAWMFMLQFLFTKFCTVKHVYSGHPI